MARLEDLTAGTAVRGVLLDETSERAPSVKARKAGARRPSGGDQADVVDGVRFK